MNKLMPILSIFMTFSVSTYADTSLKIDQDDGLANIALESAASICAQDVLASFLNSAQGTFSVSIHSKTFPTGLKSVSIVLESKTKQLAVVKPYVLLIASPSMSPICNLSTKGLSGAN